MRETKSPTAPLVSIIMISYNTSEMTIAAIQSVYETTTDIDFEFFVYDNKSTDGSAEAIPARFPRFDYPNFIFEPLTENLGFAKANNLAARHARGQYILLLNPDTIVLPGAIQNLLEFAKRRPNAQIWGARNVLGDGTLDFGSCWGQMTLWSVFCFTSGLERIFPNTPFFKPEGYGGWDRTTEREVAIITGCFFLTDTKLWKVLKGFDERFFMYAEEADYCIRARALGAAPRFTPDAEIIHFGGASEAVRAQRISKMFSGKITLADKHWPAWKVSILRSLYKMAVLNRWIGYSLFGLLTKSAERRAQGAEWKQIWKTRKTWVMGY